MEKHKTEKKRIALEIEIILAGRKGFQKLSEKNNGKKTDQPSAQGYFLIFQFFNNSQGKALKLFIQYNHLAVAQ